VKRREFHIASSAARRRGPLRLAHSSQRCHVGYSQCRSRGTDTPFLAAFLAALNETAPVERQNVTDRYRWAEGQYDRPPRNGCRPRNFVSAVIAANTLRRRCAMRRPRKLRFSSYRLTQSRMALFTSLNRPGRHMTGVS